MGYDRQESRSVRRDRKDSRPERRRDDDPRQASQSRRMEGDKHQMEYEEDFEDINDHWDEYRPEQMPMSRDQVMGPDNPNVNMISNLVRWAFKARSRMSHEALMDYLRLYMASGKYSEELRDMIGYICDIVGENPTYEPDPSQECVDLIHQLHGILAGDSHISHRMPPKISHNGHSGGQDRKGLYTNGRG